MFSLKECYWIHQKLIHQLNSHHGKPRFSPLNWPRNSVNNRLYSRSSKQCWMSNFHHWEKLIHVYVNDGWKWKIFNPMLLSSDFFYGNPNKIHLPTYITVWQFLILWHLWIKVGRMIDERPVDTMESWQCKTGSVLPT